MANRTLKQIEASRRNGAKSRGPLTSNRTLNENRDRYELVAEATLLPGENRERFIEKLHALHLQWCPANESESDLVELIASAHWQKLRILSLRTASMQLAMSRKEGPAPNRALEAHKEQDQSLAALRREELDADRQYRSAVKLLLLIRNTRCRPSAPPPPPEPNPSSPPPSPPIGAPNQRPKNKPFPLSAKSKMLN